MEAEDGGAHQQPKHAEKLRQKHEFKASLSYTEKPCLKRLNEKEEV